jgi:hypothetical protein
MKNISTNTWTHKGWTIYKAGPFPGFPKKYVLYPPDDSHGERFEEPTLHQAEALINGLLRLDALNARLKWEAEWIEIEE